MTPGVQECADCSSCRWGITPHGSIRHRTSRNLCKQHQNSIFLSRLPGSYQWRSRWGDMNVQLYICAVTGCIERLILYTRSLFSWYSFRNFWHEFFEHLSLCTGAVWTVRTLWNDTSVKSPSPKSWRNLPFFFSLSLLCLIRIEIQRPGPEVKCVGVLPMVSSKSDEVKLISDRRVVGWYCLWRTFLGRPSWWRLPVH